MDPLRDVTVTDLRLPESSTRVDMVSSWKFDKEKKTYAANPSGMIQLIRERMRSVADGGVPPLVPVRIGLRRNLVIRRRAQAARADSHPKQSPESIFDLLLALESHHAPLWRRDMEKFFSTTGQRLEQSLDVFAGISRDGDRPAAALARIGWAAHAEAKSIEGFREIHRPQPKFRGTHYAHEGSTRHVVNPPGGPYPFGWALLVMADAWKEAKESISWLSAGRVARRPGGKQSSSRQSSAERRGLRYHQGDLVRLDDGSEARLLEHVKEGQSEVQVDIDGSPEPVKVSEIEGLA